jgi:hypothetical protein
MCSDNSRLARLGLCAARTAGQAVEPIDDLLGFDHGPRLAAQGLGQLPLELLQAADRRLHVLLDQAAHGRAQLRFRQSQRPALDLLAELIALLLQRRACVVPLGGQEVHLALDLLHQRAEPARLLQLSHGPPA